MLPTTDVCIIRGMENSDIGDRIAALLAKKDLSQSDLARALDIKPQAVQKWVAGGKPRPARLRQIAAVFGISLQDLVKNTVYDSLSPEQSIDKGRKANVRLVPKRDQITESSPPEFAGKLPLISWAQAGVWADLMDNFATEDALDWIEVPGKHGQRSFCLTIEDESMYNPGGPKSYAEGEVIAVDPDKIPRNRSTVAVRIGNAERAVLRQLLTDGDTMMLKALNPSWPNGLIELPVDAKVIGTVVGKWVPE